MEVDVEPLFFRGVDKSGAFPQILLLCGDELHPLGEEEKSQLSRCRDVLKRIRSLVMQDVYAELRAIMKLQKEGHVIVKAVHVSGYNISKEFYLDCERDWKYTKEDEVAYESAFGGALMRFFRFGADTIEKIVLVAPVTHWGSYSEPDQMKQKFPCMTALRRVEAKCFPG